MASGFTINGVDFDALFEPDIKGDGPSAPAFTVNGVALKYAALAYGTKRADVGFQQNGVDVSNLWAQKGSAVYQGVRPDLVLFLEVSIPQGWTGPSGLPYAVSMRGSGTFIIDRGPSTAAETGPWTTDGQPPITPYEVIVTDLVTTGDNAWQITNNCTTWTPLNQSVGNRAIVTANFNSTSAFNNVREGSYRLRVRNASTQAEVFNKVMNISLVAGTTGGNS